MADPTQIQYIEFSSDDFLADAIKSMYKDLGLSDMAIIFLVDPWKVSIIDLYDGWLARYKVNDINDIKRIMETKLPWCDEHPIPLIHGSVVVMEKETVTGYKEIYRINYYDEIDEAIKKISSSFYSY